MIPRRFSVFGVQELHRGSRECSCLGGTIPLEGPVCCAHWDLVGRKASKSTLAGLTNAKAATDPLARVLAYPPALTLQRLLGAKPDAQSDRVETLGKLGA